MFLIYDKYLVKLTIFCKTNHYIYKHFELPLKRYLFKIIWQIPKSIFQRVKIFVSNHLDNLGLIWTNQAVQYARSYFRKLKISEL